MTCSKPGMSGVNWCLIAAKQLAGWGVSDLRVAGAVFALFPLLLGLGRYPADQDPVVLLFQGVHVRDRMHMLLAAAHEHGQSLSMALIENLVVADFFDELGGLYAR